MPNLSSNKISPIDNRVVFNTNYINKKIDNLTGKVGTLLINNPIDVLVSSKNTGKVEDLKTPNNRLSNDIHNKCLKIKSILNDNVFNKFESTLNKISSDENKVNDFLDKTLHKIDPFSMSDAYKILSNVESKVPHIADVNARNNATNEEKKAVFAAIIGIGINRLNNNSYKFDIGDLSIGRGFDFKDKSQMESIAKNAIDLKSGNCGELAIAAAYEAKKLKLGKIEFFSVQYSENVNHNHVFIVLNRENNTNDEHPKSWGKNCIVLDPWTKETYPAKDFFNHDVMKNTTPIYQGEY